MSAWLIRSGLIQADRSTVIVEANYEAQAIRIFERWAQENPDKVDRSGNLGNWVEAEKLDTPVAYFPGD